MIASILQINLVASAGANEMEASWSKEKKNQQQTAAATTWATPIQMDFSFHFPWWLFQLNCQSVARRRRWRSVSCATRQFGLSIKKREEKKKAQAEGWRDGRIHLQIVVRRSQFWWFDLNCPTEAVTLSLLAFFPQLYFVVFLRIIIIQWERCKKKKKVTFLEEQSLIWWFKWFFFFSGVMSQYDNKKHFRLLKWSFHENCGEKLRKE